MASTKLSMLVRKLSTTSSLNQMVKAPIQIFGIEGRYATALYSAASKQKTLESVEKELIKFQGTIKSDAKLHEFIQNPSIKRMLKSDILKNLAAQISLSTHSANLLQILAENGRLKNLNGVINAYRTIMAAHRGEVECEVITAKALEAPQRAKLESVLKAFLKTSESIKLEAKVDPSIIGGMIVSIGDRYVDMSVATKIKKYTELITTAA